MISALSKEARKANRLCKQITPCDDKPDRSELIQRYRHAVADAKLRALHTQK